MGKTENDYIAEYVKERCPELLNTVDFNLWKGKMAVGELMDEFCDHLKQVMDRLGTVESEVEDGKIN